MSDDPTSPLPVAGADRGAVRTGSGRRQDAALREATELLQRSLLTEASMPAVLHRVAEAARAGLPGVDEASVTLLGQAAPRPVATGLLADGLDVVQRTLGSGPCIEAASSGRPVWVPNTREDPHWPVFSRHAVSRGALSLLAVPVLAQRLTRASLNLYSTRVAGLDAVTRETALQYATLAAVAIEHSLGLTPSPRDPRTRS